MDGRAVLSHSLAASAALVMGSGMLTGTYDVIGTCIIILDCDKTFVTLGVDDSAPRVPVYMSV